MDPDLDPYTSRLFQIESGGNPQAVTGSNVGLGQFGPSEQKQYGITDPYNPQQQIDAVARERAAHTQIYQNRFGSDPSPGQLYLMHQQGVAGGPALMGADPSTPAWQAIRRYYGSDAVAQRAITGNIPRGSPLYGRSANDITAGDFSNYWISKFENTPASTSIASFSPSAPSGASAPTLSAEPAPQPAGASGFESPQQTAQLAQQELEQPRLQPAQMQPLQPISPRQKLLAVLMRQQMENQQTPFQSPYAQRLIDVIGQS